MRLNINDFALVLDAEDSEQEEEETHDQDLESEIAIEMRRDGERVEDLPAGLPMLPQEFFSSVPDPRITSAAEQMKQTIGSEARENWEKIAPADLPYAVHPGVAKHDSIVIYDERDEDNQRAYQRAEASVAGTSRAITMQLRRVLIARSQSRTVRDQERGRLDRRKLATLNCPGRLPNKRIFVETHQGQTQNVAIGLLVDQSGSMNENGKIYCAQRSAIALATALDQLKTLGVKFALWGFDADTQYRPKGVCSERRGPGRTSCDWDRCDTIRIHVYKEAHEDWGKVAARMGAMTNLRNNVDGESVRWAAKELLSIKADRHVLIVLSDGHPVGGFRGNDRMAADLKAAVQELGEHGVETLGIGIKTSAVKNFYSNHIVIHEPQELERTLMGALKELFGVGRRAA